MLFQLVTSFLVAIGLIATSVSAKEAPKETQQIMYVQCQFVDLLNGREESQWAMDHNQSYVAVTGNKNADNEFVTNHNEQLVRDFCAYTKRARYGDEKVEMYEASGMLASPSSFGSSVFGSSVVPLVFDSERDYPANIDPDWANKLKPGKIKPKNSAQIFIAKVAAVSMSIAGIGYGFRHYPSFMKEVLPPAASAALLAMAVVDFIFEEGINLQKAGKMIEKGDKLGDKLKPKKS